jgi:hypothetical protein
MYGLTLGEAAVIRSREAERCAFCRVPPFDVHASDGAKLAWLDGYDPELATAARAEQAAADRNDSFRDWRNEVRRAAWDSQLEPTLPLPAEDLEVILEQCDGDMREFLCDRLVFAVCGACRAREMSPAHIAERLTEIYVDAYYDGNVVAAKVQPAWELFERSLALIDPTRVAASSARSG